MKGFLFVLGLVEPIGKWTSDVELVWSVLAAVLTGLIVAKLANSDGLHKYLRDKWKITTRTSYPSEWYSAFIRNVKFVILHLKGNRRLFGFPEEWPDNPASGHFVIAYPHWILKDNTKVAVHATSKILVQVADVEMVEFVKSDAELSVDPESLAQFKALLIGLQAKGVEKEDGSQGAAASAEPASRR